MGDRHPQMSFNKLSPNLLKQPCPPTFAELSEASARRIARMRKLSAIDEPLATSEQVQLTAIKLLQLPNQTKGGR